MMLAKGLIRKPIDVKLKLNATPELPLSCVTRGCTDVPQ